MIRLERIVAYVQILFRAAQCMRILGILSTASYCQRRDASFKEIDWQQAKVLISTKSYIPAAGGTQDFRTD